MALSLYERLGRAEMESIYVLRASKDLRSVAKNNSWWQCAKLVVTRRPEISLDDADGQEARLMPQA